MAQKLVLSPLPKTWIFDLDGTLVQHNGYLTGTDTWLPGAREFLQAIPDEDYVLILTAREERYREQTETFLQAAGVRYDAIQFGMPVGERILLNDDKPSGLVMSQAVSLARNQGLAELSVLIDKNK
ncbi:MAG: hypothetical protein SOZ01_11215 [Selenomonadaceae bacterium]|nr:hypothetical protein [Selenomonadaceae bacterium]